jgi:hypothetical protein
VWLGVAGEEDTVKVLWAIGRDLGDVAKGGLDKGVLIGIVRVEAQPLQVPVHLGNGSVE